jgi:hypothetical protein
MTCRSRPYHGGLNPSLHFAAEAFSFSQVAQTAAATPAIVFNVRPPGSARSVYDSKGIEKPGAKST